MMKISLLYISLFAACALCWISCFSGHKGGASMASEKTTGDTLKDEIEPVMIYDAKPEYPKIALDRGVTAEVLIKAFVDTLGGVKRVLLGSCSIPGYGFEDAAIKAAYKCQYKPAWEKGHKVGVWVQYNMKFKLNH
jgi:TonB family protein